MSKSIVFLSFSLIASNPQVASAIEPFCVNNPNVIFCDGFEPGDTPLGPGSLGPNIAATTQFPLTGQYSMEFDYPEFGAPGFTTPNFSSPSGEIWARYYIYLDALYHWGYLGGTHTGFVYGSGGTNCPGEPTGGDEAVEIVPTAASLGIVRYGNACGVGLGSHGLTANMGTPDQQILRNGKWYRIEYHLKLNSIDGCVDKNGDGVFEDGECDGVIEVWIDGNQVAGFYDINFRGNDNPNYNFSGFMINHYYSAPSGQSYKGKTFHEYRDNIVFVSGNNGGHPIGPVANEPFLGTPDPYSPYVTEIYKEWNAFDSNGTLIHPGGDCTYSALAGQCVNDWVNNSGSCSYVSSPAHNAVQSPCASNISAGNDKAIAAETSSGHQYAGGGQGYLMRSSWVPSGNYTVNAWMYLDPATFPAPNGAALHGMLVYAGDGIRNYMALGVDSQDHPTLLRQADAPNGAAPTVLAVNTGVIVTPGIWHQFEVRGGNGSWSALLDGATVVAATGVDDSFLSKDPVTPGLWTYHYGILDHMNNPGPLRVYVDEESAGSTSFQDCWGWNPETCPFAGLPPVSSPSAPRNLRVN